MAPTSMSLAGNGLVVVPRVADPAWVAEHGAPTVE